MRKLIITMFIASGLMIVNLNGQSTDKSTVILGDWYACGLKSIQINDTAEFYRTDSICTNNNCLYYKWEIDKKEKFKSGIQTGCSDTKIGYGLKKQYKWSLDNKNDLLSINKSSSIEVYQILILTDNMIKVLRIK